MIWKITCLSATTTSPYDAVRLRHVTLYEEMGGVLVRRLNAPYVTCNERNVDA